MKPLSHRLWYALALAPVVTLGCPRPPAAPPSPPHEALFREVAAEAGVTYRWRVPGGEKRPLNSLQTIGNGCAFLDFNQDGNLDILLVGEPCALYQGNKNKTFQDVSATALAGISGYFLGVAVGDFDNDGFPDLYLTGYREGRLLHNVGGTRFEDTTAASGIARQPWSTSAAFADLDQDGRLDLFIGNYYVFGPDTIPQLCTTKGKLTACGPRYYKPLKGVLYRGLGGGRFADVTRGSGVDRSEGKTLGVAIADFDGTGKLALALANDETPGNLLRHQGGMRFRDLGSSSGVAYSKSGNLQGGMGIDWGDFDNDGRLDLFVGTFQSETKCLYRNEGDGTFTERGDELGLVPARPLVTFGGKWLDFDNDGYLDLIFASGHVQDNIDALDDTGHYRQPTLLFHNRGGSAFENVTARMDPKAQAPLVGRGLATGDFDNDGKIDVLIVDSEGAPLLLHNEAKTTGHFLCLTLVGTRSPRSAYGATVTIQAGGRTLLRHVHADGSYLSSSDPRVHVGLGKASTATVTVRWPGGASQTFPDLAADAFYRLTEGETAVKQRP